MGMLWEEHEGEFKELKYLKRERGEHGYMTQEHSDITKGSTNDNRNTSTWKMARKSRDYFQPQYWNTDMQLNGISFEVVSLREITHLSQ